MSDAPSLEARLERLERERHEADERYNAALTALDQAIGRLPEFPQAPPPYDAAKLSDLNAGFDLLSGGPPRIDRSVKGRLRGFIWRIVGPPLEAQRQFNAALVEHLNRNVAAHQETERSIASAITVVREQLEALIRFEVHLIQYLQTVTLYVDTRDRSAAGGAHVLNAALSALADDWLRRWESLTAREARLSGRADAVMASLDDLRRTSAIAQQSAVSLKRDVERALNRFEAMAPSGFAAEFPAATPPTSHGPVRDLDAFKYVAFENAFRGEPAEISRRLAAYVPVFEGQHDVVDLGCGRGEFLALLREAGITARGIDVNAAMVEETRARGLEAEVADALGFLRSLPDASIGGVFAAQVVEHLEPGYLASVVEEAGRAMRPGGVIVLETINPTSWVAFFESYIRDLTHVRPLHPETLKFLLEVSGFANVRVQFSSPVDPLARLQRVPAALSGADPAMADLTATVNDNVERLNARLFGAQDYAVVGYR